MKPKDILPDEMDSVEKSGVTIRKGTIGAFTENIRIIESSKENSAEYRDAVADLLQLVPALRELRFFEFYQIKSKKVRSLIGERFPELK